MKEFTVFGADGLVARFGMCQDYDFDLQALEGETTLEGSFNADAIYLREGVVTEYTPEQRLLKNTRPSNLHIWNNQTESWDDPRTLAQAKSDAWEAIKLQRDTRMAGTFTHTGNTYDIDPVNLSGASIDAREALIAGEEWSQMWVLSDNTVVTLNAIEMIAVGRACKAVVSDLWATSQYLRGLIESATTIAEVDSVTW